MNIPSALKRDANNVAPFMLDPRIPLTIRHVHQS
jgi:hypothetical protein